MFQIKQQRARYESHIRTVPTPSKIRWQKMFVECHLLSPFFLDSVSILSCQHRENN